MCGRATEAWHAGGENGFSQAIELASDTLSNVKFVQEKRLISKFFDEISQDTGKYGFGVSETLQLMEMGAVETLIVWENLETDRVVLKNQATGDEVIKYLSKEQQQKAETYRCGPLLRFPTIGTLYLCVSLLLSTCRRNSSSWQKRTGAALCCAFQQRHPFSCAVLFLSLLPSTCQWSSSSEADGALHPLFFVLLQPSTC